MQCILSAQSYARVLWVGQINGKDTFEYKSGWLMVRIEPVFLKMNSTLHQVQD